jgi:hypothetical protein
LEAVEAHLTDGIRIGLDGSYYRMNVGIVARYADVPEVFEINQLGSVYDGGTEILWLVHRSIYICIFDRILDLLIESSDKQLFFFLGEKFIPEIIVISDCVIQIWVPLRGSGGGRVEYARGHQLIILWPADGFEIGSPEVRLTIKFIFHHDAGEEVRIIFGYAVDPCLLKMYQGIALVRFLVTHTPHDIEVFQRYLELPVSGSNVLEQVVIVHIITLGTACVVYAPLSLVYIAEYLFRPA